MSSIKISEISSHNDAMMEAIHRWHRGNDMGAGFAPQNTERDTRLLSARNDVEVDVYEDLEDGHEYAVGEANGPWAVRI